ncbi:MAG: DJ-1/PfpI family protein [Bacteroidota bacterium]
MNTGVQKKMTLILLTFQIVIYGQDASNMDSYGYVCPPCNRKCDNIKFTEPGICEHCNMELIKEHELMDYPKINRKRIGFYLQSGVEILDLAGPMEVFAYAGYEVFTISKTKEQIYAQGILTVTPDYNLSDAPEADMLVFFGGNSVLPSKDMELIQWLKSQKNTEYFFSVCSGALFLAEAGILDNKKATTFRYVLDVLEEGYPKVDVIRGARYVDNGRVVTTAGVSAGIDGALHMVAKLEGLPKAAETAFYMEYDWVPNRGMSFADTNPYAQMNDFSILKQYEGIFKTEGESEIILELDQSDGQLNMVLNGKNHPIFYIEKDRFLTSHASHLLTFQRDSENYVIEVESTENKEVFKRKSNEQ